MMDYRNLLKQYLKGEISNADLVKLLDYIKNNPEEEFDQLCHEIWQSDEETPLPRQKELFREINQKIIQSQRERKVSSFTLTKIAASLVLLILSVIAVILLLPSENPKSQHHVKSISHSTPTGQKSKIYLPDGSVVWLNAESHLSYTSEFNHQQRKVKLSGEAFFEVKTNPAKPFSVQSRDVTTTALGTSFNVKAYPGDGEITVALNTGNVKVQHSSEGRQPIFLEAGKATKFDEVTNQFSQFEFDFVNKIGWKDGIIAFQDASQQEVFTILSRWYGVKFQFQNQSEDVNWSYSGIFSDEYLDNILESIGFSKQFTFNIEDKTVKIKFE